MREQFTTDDLETLREIDVEETRPGEGIIHQGYSDDMVRRGFAEGDFDTGYRLTEAGRLAIQGAI